MRRLIRCLVVVLAALPAACGTFPRRTCQDGGEAVRPANPRWPGTRQCWQRKNKDGKWVNDGPYIDWYPNGKRAMKGEFRMGLRNGKWEKWDPTGKKISVQYFQNGVEVPRFDTSLKKAEHAPGSEPSPTPTFIPK